MKILIVTSHLYMAEGSIAKGIAESLTKHDIFFFSVHSFKDRLGEFEKLTQNVDVVHWLFNVGNLEKKYFDFYKKLNTPTVATVHHIDKDELYKIKAASFSDLIHVVSNEWLDFCFTKTKTSLLLAHLGLSTKKFDNIKPNLYKGKGVLKIGLMGFYPGKNNRKRVDVLINVLKRLIEKKVDVELIVQGTGWDKYYDLFEKIGVNYKHYKFSEIKNMYNFFEKIHVYLCTSDVEGGPFPVLESLICGIPVISTKVGMSLDLLKQGGGILCDRGDVSSIVDAVICLKENNDFYNLLSNKALKISNNLSWKNLTKDYELLYKQTVEKWELKNGLKWVFKHKNIISPIDQRDIEISYSDIHQVRGLLKNKNTISAFKILFSLLFNSKIDFYSKRKLLNELVLLYFPFLKSLKKNIIT